MARLGCVGSLFVAMRMNADKMTKFGMNNDWCRLDKKPYYRDEGACEGERDREKVSKE